MKPVLVVFLSLIPFFGLPAAVSAVAVSPEISVAAKKPAKEMKEVTFSTHLHCEDCVKKVQENISFEKGVKDLEVSLEKQTIWIKYDASRTDEAKLKAAIEELGYKAEKIEKEID